MSRFYFDSDPASRSLLALINVHDKRLRFGAQALFSFILLSNAEELESQVVDAHFLTSFTADSEEQIEEYLHELIAHDCLKSLPENQAPQNSSTVVIELPEKELSA